MVNIVKNLSVPTGNILILKSQMYEDKYMECLSLYTYDKSDSLKADFLGYTKPLEEVVSTKTIPLEEKWVCTVSTQFGCSMNCKFCDVPKVGKGVNIPFSDLKNQIQAVISLHPEVKKTKRLNLHFVRMGEPTWNLDVIECIRWVKNNVLPGSLINPVVATMMPRHNKDLEAFLNAYMYLKNDVYNGNAGLQFSINSTDDNAREDMFSHNSHTLEEISKIVDKLREPVGRKLVLNFALAGYPIDAKKLAALFDPKKFAVKLTPLHATNTAKANGYEFAMPYQKLEEDLKKNGFDVLVAFSSYEEDFGRITCGNAILSNPSLLK